MDNMSYSWVSPQEDEFALVALGAPSPYESLIVPSLMRDPKALGRLRQRSSAEQKAWGEALRCFLLLLTLQQRKTIVLQVSSAWIQATSVALDVPTMPGT